MKNHVLIILLLVLLTSCGPKIDTFEQYEVELQSIFDAAWDECNEVDVCFYSCFLTPTPEDLKALKSLRQDLKKLNTVGDIDFAHQYLIDGFDHFVEYCQANLDAEPESVLEEIGEEIIASWERFDDLAKKSVFDFLW